MEANSRPAPIADAVRSPTSPLWRGAWAAGLVYLLLSVLLTWPVIVEPGSFLFGDYGDTRAWAWWIWAKSGGHLDGPVNALIAAPFGIPTSQVITQPLHEGLVLLLARLTGEIAAINLFVFLALPLTALATFVVLHRLLANGAAAFAGGLIFGFSPAAVMQAAGGHAEFALGVFIPLFLLALLHNQSRRSPASALLLAASYAGVIFVSIYLAYFTLIAASLFVAFDYLTCPAEEGGRVARNYLLCAALAVLIILPVEYRAIAEQLGSSREVVARAGRIRDFSDVAAFSARPWDYVVPSIDHPVLGRFFEAYVRNNLHGSNVFERTLYLGMVPLALLLLGLALKVRGSLNAGHSRLFVIAFVGAVAMYLVSLPPLLAGGVPTFSFFAYEIAPMFRVYSRAGILVLFFVGCAAAVTLAHLGARMTPARFRILAAVLIGACAFEFWSVAPGQARFVADAPPVYRWLAQQPGDILVAEYPMVSFDEAAFYSYPFWQRVHGKRLLNGATPDNARAWALFQKVRDLGHPDTPGILRAAGVHYVIVHRQKYAEGPVPEPIKRYYGPARAAITFDGGRPPGIPASLRLEKSFGNEKVFALDERR